MRQVFSLKKRLAEKTDFKVGIVDNHNPSFAYQNLHGLYGSIEWWKNIKNGSAPLSETIGTIAGKKYLDRSSTNPVFEISIPNGYVTTHSYYTDTDDDLKYYKIEKKIKVIYVSEKLITPVKTVKTKAPNSQRSITDVKIVLAIFIEE